MACDICEDDSPIINVINLAPMSGAAWVLVLKCDGCVRRAILELQAMLEANEKRYPRSVEREYSG